MTWKASFLISHAFSVHCQVWFYFWVLYYAVCLAHANSFMVSLSVPSGFFFVLLLSLVKTLSQAFSKRVESTICFDDLLWLEVFAVPLRVWHWLLENSFLSVSSASRIFSQAIVLWYLAVPVRFLSLSGSPWVVLVRVWLTGPWRDPSPLLEVWIWSTVSTVEPCGTESHCHTGGSPAEPAELVSRRCSES